MKESGRPDQPGQRQASETDRTRAVRRRACGSASHGLLVVRSEREAERFPGDCATASSTQGKGQKGKRGPDRRIPISPVGSRCGAKGKVQVCRQVKLLPAPQLLPESAGLDTLK
jgi:hypothetical protein